MWRVLELELLSELNMEVIAASTSILSVRYGVLDAETHAIKEGFCVTACFDFTEITMESNCQNAISTRFYVL